MDSIVLASESLGALSSVMEIAFAMLGTVLAVVAGTFVAFKLSPFDPSSAESSVSHERHIDFQRKLALVRKARYAPQHIASNPDAETRRTSDATVPDLALAESFSVVPVRTIAVGGVRPLPMLQVG